MSCFNCYSARKIDSYAVEEILDRGYKLRNAMMQTIMNNDSVHNLEHKTVKLDDLPSETNNKIKAFLQGDAMSRADEMSTLETLRSMSATDLCKATNQTYRSQEPCDCPTCCEYTSKDLKCDLRRGGDYNEITQKIQDRYKSESSSLLKYVDSVKISVGSVVLTEAGDKKVTNSVVKDKTSLVGHTFFLEYTIPDVIGKHQEKNKAKVDSGLDSRNVVRLCARRTLTTITFKQASVHDVVNLQRVRLQDVIIIFRLSSRNTKQKHAVPLGTAKFSFGGFEVNKNFTCNQELALRLNDNAPIVVGTLKVSVQLGCGRLYFGKEFIDAVTNNKENSVVLGSDELSSSGSEIIDCTISTRFHNPKSNSGVCDALVPKLKLNTQKPERFGHKSHPFDQKPERFIQKSERLIQKSERFHKKPEQFVQEPERFIQKSERLIQKSERFHKKPEQFVQEPERFIQKPERLIQKSERFHKKPEQFVQEPERFAQRSQRFAEEPEATVQKPCSKPVLFGFVYISEAQFSRQVLNSYLACQLFAQDDVSFSKCIAFDSTPVYNFSQKIPLVYGEDFPLSLRENFMVIEFFEKCQPKDFLLGIAKLSLHQFYLAYRNLFIVKYLSERELPVIDFDGWDSIVNPNDDEIVGQAQILLALGTREQIDFLERERGFCKDQVKAKTTAKVFKKIDAAVQSNMEPKTDIETLLKQIVAQKERPVQMENGTNTEPQIPENGLVRSTSDLLDSLQKALTVEENNCFKAHVAINSALHLPSRKKCKSKRSKARNARHEDILPSTYVTFEAYKDLKITPIVPKSTAPKWEFQTDVLFPIEYLTDNQKFLVFKVWRKSTNTTMTPNMQIDHVIGFATVDLTVLAAGLPSVQGWYNINDLSKKCNGQINVHVTPLENVTKYQSQQCCATASNDQEPESAPEDEPNELLGRALKRKFTELDEITQRLRLRLSKVTNDESEASNDEVADEFEHDINTLCVEDDFDMIDFEKESGDCDQDDQIRLLQADRHLVEGKLKIDQLLEKLSLMSGENSSRYVSGCSDVRLDAESIFQDLDTASRPNLFSGDSFNREMIQKFGDVMGGYESRAGPEGGNKHESSG